MSDYFPAAEDVLPLFRRSDPPTSRAAAARVREFSGDHCRRVLDALEQGPAGQTEIAARCGLLPHQVNKRLNELAMAGANELTGLLCESSSGGKERQWRRCG